MGDGAEILLWLLVMAIIAIRGAAQNRQRAMRRDAEGDGDEAADALAAPRAPGASRPRGGGSRATAATSGDSARRTGLLDRMVEYANELERQARETEARRAGAAAGAERTVVVPGRRVRPLSVEGRAQPAEAPLRTADDIATQPGAEITRPWRREGARHLEAARISRRTGIPPAAEPESEGDVRRPRRPGLGRLDRYAPLQRAIVLSEVLGRPPGLGETGPAERRWLEDAGE